MGDVIGFLKPNYPGERRVALLPKDIIKCRTGIVYDEIFIEKGFGQFLDIADNDYIEVGCRVVERDEIFALPRLFCLKLIQRSDYGSLRKGQKLIGWMHPNGSGRQFCEYAATQLSIDIFDIDSVYPRVFRADGQVIDIDSIPRHLFWKNSYIAGMASTKLAIDYLQLDVSSLRSVAILGSGSVAQGAFCYLAQRGVEPRLFYRKTLSFFYNMVSDFDLIVNGIEVDAENLHIIDKCCLSRMSSDVVIVDAAADAGRAIQGTEYLSLESPVGIVEGRRYVLVNNAPTLMHDVASNEISRVVSSVFLTQIIL